MKKNILIWRIAVLISYEIIMIINKKDFDN